MSGGGHFPFNELFYKVILWHNLTGVRIVVTTKIEDFLEIVRFSGKI